MFNKTMPNVKVLMEYQNKTFEVGNGTSHPYKNVIGLEIALAKLTEMKGKCHDQNWNFRCRCIDTNECFMVLEGEIKKQNC